MCLGGPLNLLEAFEERFPRGCHLRPCRIGSRFGRPHQLQEVLDEREQARDETEGSIEDPPPVRKGARQSSAQ